MVSTKDIKIHIKNLAEHKKVVSNLEKIIGKCYYSLSISIHIYLYKYIPYATIKIIEFSTIKIKCGNQTSMKKSFKNWQMPIF